MKLERTPALPDDLRDEERTLLAARAAQLRQRAQGAVEEAHVWVAAFSVGGITYGLPLEHVCAAIPLRMVTPVPLAPTHVIGVLRFRGTVSTVLSLASLLGVRGWKVDPAVLLIVDVTGDERARDRVVAIDCEQIPRALSLPASAVDAARSAHRGGALIEVTLPDLTQVTLLDLSALVAAAAGGQRAG